MIQDDWKPTDEDLEWTKEHFERMQIGDTWGVADAVLKKVSDNHLNVESATPSSMMPLERIGKVCVELDIDFTAADAEIVHDPQEAAQKAALEWTHESGIPVSNFDMENAEWVCLDEDESWRVIVRHESDDPDKPHEVALAPMDYHLLAGDELFFSWKGMLVLEREEIIGMTDDGSLMRSLETGDVIVMPTTWNHELVPPHLRGLIFNTVRDEEE